MTVHIAWVADEYLLGQGFTITDPGPGLPRTAVRGDLSYELDPRCGCEYCPEPRHENYRYTAGVSA